VTSAVPTGVPPRPATLFDLLACPHCHGDLALESAVTSVEWVVHADLRCSKHGRVGVVDDFRPSFLDRELNACPEGIRDSVARLRLDLDGPTTTRSGRWEPLDGGLRASDPGLEAVLSFEAGAIGFEVELWSHDWAGIVRLQVDDGPVAELDLYRPEGSGAVSWSHDGIPEGRHRLSITATGRRSPQAVATQVLVRSVHALVPPTSAPPPAFRELNRGNGYHRRYLELLTEMPEDAIVLDCGGGDRCLGDPRVFNLEYLRFELPDLYADGLSLPLRSDSFDLVYSQAVLEHVTDPQVAVDEMTRILKPGGTLFMDIAFMQPLHAVPFHYYNVTPHGVEHLGRHLERVGSGWEGGLQESVGWWSRIMGADVILGPVRHAVFLELLRALDEGTDHKTLKHFAFSVWFEGRKLASTPHAASAS